MKRFVTLVLAVLLVSLIPAAAASAGYSKNPSLTVWKSDVSPFPASAGGDLFVQVVARNYGQDDAEDFTVEFELSYPFTLKSEAERVQEFPEGLCGFCDRELEYHILVDEDAKTGTYPIKLKLSHTYGGVVTTMTRELELSVTGSKRVLGVYETNAAEQNFGVGEDSTLEVTLKNYGREQLNYIEATLQTPAGIHVLGSNKRFITSPVQSGKNIPLSFDLVVAGDASEGAYSVPLILNFRDASGTETTLNETIGIAVRGEPQLLIFAEGSDPLYAGAKGDLLITLANIAPYNIKFLKVEIESDDLIFLSDSSEYVGDMEPDDLESADFDIFIPAGATSPEIKVKMEYRDNYNKQYTKEETVAVKLASVAQASQSEGINLWIIVAAVVIIVAGVWYWRKKKHHA